jgi:hypothetical protein
MQANNWTTLAFTAAISLFSCNKKDDNNPTSPTPNTKQQVTATIDGEGITHEAITISAVEGIADIGATYLTNNKYTALKIDNRKSATDKPTDVFVMAIDGGNATSTQSFDAPLRLGGQLEDHVNIVLTASINGKLYIFDSSGGTGTITIQTYGAVGEFIEGSFSGTMFNQVNGKPVKVTDGHFTLIRLADQKVEE